MKNKALSIIVFCGSILTLFFLICFFPRTVRFSKYCVSEAEYIEIIMNREPIEDNVLEYICFNDYELFYDSVNSRWIYSLIEEDVDAYDPYLEYKCNVDDVTIAIKETEITKDLIGSNGRISLIAYTEECYKEYSLVCTTLPVMHITSNDGIAENYVQMKVVLFDNRSSATQRWLESAGGIRTRGATTLSFPKKGYRVTLTGESVAGHTRKNHVSLLGMRQDDDWILYAAYNDQEKIRNVFSSNLWYGSCAQNNSSGINNGMEYKYVELLINDEYYGLYALGYPIDEKQLNITGNGINEVKEYIFEKKAWASEKEIEDIDEVEVAGYEIVNNIGEEEKKDAWEILKEYYREYFKVIDSNPEKLLNSIDVDNAIDTYLFINLIQGYDHVGGMKIKNLFLTFKQENGDLKLVYTPWDMDMCWGNYWDGEAHNNTLEYYRPATDNCIMESNPIHKLIETENQEVIDRVIDRYIELRNSVWSDESIKNILTEYEADIFKSGAFLRDQERWPEGQYNSSQTGLNMFEDYVLKRFSCMDQWVKELSIK